MVPLFLSQIVLLCIIGHEFGLLWSSGLYIKERWYVVHVEFEVLMSPAEDYCPVECDAILFCR